MNHAKVLSKPLVIAIDGPAASGKGTVAKQIAKILGLSYLDTGKIYRAVAYKLLEQAIDPADETQALAIAEKITLEDIQHPHLYKEKVGGIASVISAYPSVRKALLNFQQEFSDCSNGAILDGRDIGTVVCPHADYKFFITAEASTRAKRRYDELHAKGNPLTFEQVAEEIKRRDKRDSSRKAAPLKAADDAVSIDTTHLSSDEVVEQVLELIKETRIN